MQNALLVLQIIADIFLRASKNKPYFQRCLFKAFFLVKCLHMNLMYWHQNTDLDIT